MAGVKGNRRILYTKKIIKESLIELLENKKIHQITVTDICKSANINRGTFYTHYKDAYDLLQSMEDDLFNQILESIEENDKINLFCYITNLEFENGVEYTEKEINHKLVNYYEDYALLRRYLVDFGLLERSKDCSVYIRKQDREYGANNNH